MLNTKQKLILTILNVIELFLLVIALIILTIVFKIVEEPIRYLFMFGNVYVIYSFSKSLANLENIVQRNETNKSSIMEQVSI